MKRQKINTDDIILQFSDDANIIHEVSLSNMLDAGVPIDSESGQDMTYLQTFVISG